MRRVCSWCDKVLDPGRAGNPTTHTICRSCDLKQQRAELAPRVRAAVRAGEEAFWAVIAEAFPEAESGDLSPDAVDDMQRALLRATHRWVEANVMR